jgi:hypothetical protein
MRGGKHRKTNHTTPNHTMNTVEETIRGTQKALSNKIKACKTREDLRVAEKKCERMYNAGCLSVYAYMMLDNMITRRVALLED